MEALMMLLILILLFLSYGARGTFMKFAQQGRVSTLKQALVYTALYSLLQFLVLIAVPPYLSLICEPGFYIYPLGFAIFYSLGYILLVMAISCGSTSITNTVNAFNCLIPVFFGVIVWKEELSVYKIIGLMLFAVGLILYNKSSYSVGGIKHKITLRWVFYVIASTVSMGIAVAFTKVCMAKFPECGEVYLIYYTLFSTIIGMVCVLLWAREDAKHLFADVKFIWYTLVAAVAFNVSNYVFVTYINNFASAFFIPMCSVVGMISILIFGRIFLKEKISRSAVISSLICILAIVLLNF